MTNMIEGWFDVVGYEDRYQITRSGRVRSKKRYVNSPICGGARLIGGRVLKPQMVKGYPAIHMQINDVRHTLYIHRMLGKLFVPNPENKPEINHKDGDKTNNSINNLEWCTHLENMRHAYATGLAKAPDVGPGEDCPAAKLDDGKVRDIKRRIARGESQAAIARVYSVVAGTIGFIARGVTWSHISP